VFLKAVSKSAATNKDLKYSATYKIPIAHGEGRFYAPDEMLKSIEDNDQVLFRYASHQGEVSDEFNPNGSLHNIAGITNKKKNVFGMMPHPERAADEQLNNLDGKAIFESILNHCS
jgi:phosphoribosylformylglycinamidine synthase